MPDAEPLRRLGGGRWETRDGRFRIEPQTGTWVVIDGDQTDDLGLPLVRGPFPSLTAARGAIALARGQATSISPLAAVVEASRATRKQPSGVVKRDEAPRRRARDPRRRLEEAAHAGADSVARADLEALRTITQAAVPAYLRDLRRLVDVDCGSYSKAGVDEVGTWVAERLVELGASVVGHANEDLGDTIVGTFEGDASGPCVLLLGHLDTVFDPGTVAQRPFTIRDGRAYGPGVCDMKAGLLTALYALDALRSVAVARAPGSAPGSDTSWLPVGRLVFIANPDEEIGSPASSAVIVEQAAHADAALVLEPARENGDIVSSRKGRLDMRLHVSGRAAHAGVRPEDGRSAVLEAAHLIVALHGLDRRIPGVSVNTGVVRGGTRPNVVAESATIEVDVRAGTRRDLKAVEAAIRRLVSAPTVDGVKSTVEVVSRHQPMERTGDTERLVRHAVGIAARLGFELGDTGTGGASDGNTTAGLGVPTIDGLGPVGGLAHAQGEYIELDSIVPRTVLLAGLLDAIAGDPSLRTRPGDQVTAPR
jgi:glutamate carboxypeptidase